jgi:hypothetical protein
MIRVDSIRINEDAIERMGKLAMGAISETPGLGRVLKLHEPLENATKRMP